MKMTSETRTEQAETVDEIVRRLTNGWEYSSLSPREEAALKAGAEALRETPAPVWDCRVCGFAMLEGRALDWLRIHGTHQNTRMEIGRNAGIAYCPYCPDETLRSPAQAPQINPMPADMEALNTRLIAKAYDKGRREALRETPAQTWRPIETAPKGEEVLVWKEGSGSHVVAIWTDYAQCWVSAWAHEPIESPGFEPTHWQPLPAPPALDPSPETTKEENDQSRSDQPQPRS